MKQALPALPSAKQSKKALIALLGNPNTGKSTIFNALCQSNQRTGNFPGTTVEKKTGRLLLGNHGRTQAFELLDLPGLYSLDTSSPDQNISRDCILGQLPSSHKPDLVLFVGDMLNLRRNLFLYSQLSECGLPVVIVLTMQDLAQGKGIDIDTQALAKEFAVPVIAITAYKPQDIEALKKLLAKVCFGKKLLPKPFRSEHQESERLIATLNQSLSKSFKLSKFESYQLLTKAEFAAPLLDRLDAEAASALRKAQESYQSLLKKNPAIASLMRYRWIEKSLGKAQKKHTAPFQESMRIWDNILTHRVFGLLSFGLIMSCVFYAIYSWSEPAMDNIEWFVGELADWTQPFLQHSPILASLVQDGILAGVGAILVFLPQIMVLFFFIAILEDSGYLVRAAFLMDRLLSWCGLNGRAFIPLLSSFACAIPGIMATRVIPETRARIGTILIAPLMSCSARLPIYLLFVNALIKPHFGAAGAALCLVFMHALGLIIALPLLKLMNLTWDHSRFREFAREPFLMEFPPYKKPRLRNIAIRVSGAAKNFISKAGGIILCFSIVIWFFAYFPKQETSPEEASQQEYKAELWSYEHAKASKSANADPKQESSSLANSYLGMIGKAIAPIFAPLGFDWKITVAVLSAFPAREVFISTMSILYNTSKQDSKTSLGTNILSERRADGELFYTPLLALSLMVFFALCSQCMGTLAVIRKELLSWKWPVFVFVYMTSLAYCFSFLVYQGGSLLGFAL